VITSFLPADKYLTSKGGNLHIRKYIEQLLTQKRKRIGNVRRKPCLEHGGNNGTENFRLY
jgi:hypothetical protein